MVLGLEQFKRHFAPYAENYVLIGGTACMLAMEEAGLSLRTTRDLDIVLSIEALDGKFVEAFWQFIKAGKYQCRQKAQGRSCFIAFILQKNWVTPTCWNCSLESLTRSN